MLLVNNWAPEITWACLKIAQWFIVLPLLTSELSFHPYQCTKAGHKDGACWPIWCSGCLSSCSCVWCTYDAWFPACKKFLRIQWKSICCSFTCPVRCGSNCLEAVASFSLPCLRLSRSCASLAWFSLGHSGWKRRTNSLYTSTEEPFFSIPPNHLLPISK